MRSPSTVVRLREAEAYGLINRIARLNNGKVEVKYKLVDEGEAIIRKLMEKKEKRKLIYECRDLKKKATEIEIELNQSLNEAQLEL